MNLSSTERRSVLSIASLYAFRMLGLFMLLPVLSLYAGELSGMDYAAVGLALGIYGFTQGLLQIPFGMLSDKLGRKPVLIAGLALFLAGSLLAFVADNSTQLILGRALQGAGAVAGVLLALLSDLTTEQNRSKAMATIGATIGLSFALAMVIGPLISGWFGLQGVFGFCVVLALLAIVIAFSAVPEVDRGLGVSADVRPLRRLLPDVLRNPQLMQLNIGIAALHFIQMSMWVAVPALLEAQYGLAPSSHWWFYLVVVGASFFLMLPLMIFAEKQRQVKRVFVLAVALIALAQMFARETQQLSGFVFAVFLFFFGFNMQEARLPALISRIGPAGAKGTAMSVYSTFQFLGVFIGGLIGGLFAQHYGLTSVFLLNMGVAVFWLVIALWMREPANLRSFPLRLEAEDEDKLNSIKVQPGVIDIILVREFGEAFIKADLDRFDRVEAERILGRSL